MNSNYRLYYVDDPQFYDIVIRGEPSPYEFKIHLFLDSLNAEDQSDRQLQRDLTTKVMDRLQEMGATNINDTFMKDKKGNNDKIRLLFTIEDQQKAIACYDYFTKRHQRYIKHKYHPEIPLNDDLGISQNVLIYLQKSEEVFVRYGDIEAELYNEAEKLRAEAEEKRRAENKRDGGQRRQGKPNQRERQYNSNITAEDAMELGVNFRSEKPTFKNDRKKAEPQQREAIDNSQKDLRQIINEETAKEEEK